MAATTSSQILPTLRVSKQYYCLYTRTYMDPHSGFAVPNQFFWAHNGFGSSGSRVLEKNIPTKNGIMNVKNVNNGESFKVNVNYFGAIVSYCISVVYFRHLDLDPHSNCGSGSSCSKARKRRIHARIQIQLCALALNNWMNRTTNYGNGLPTFQFKIN